MSMVLARLRGFYGANPLHLLALLGCFALAGWAALHTLSTPAWPVILVWFVGAVIAHDLVLFPLYALADRAHTAGVHGLRRRRGHHREHPPRVSAVNYLRIPVLASGLLFLVFFPGIIAQGASTYLAATGQTQAPFLGRWLLLTAIAFALSALAYTTHLGLAHRKAGSSSSAATAGGGTAGGGAPGAGVEEPRE